jgi:hypothetical protein
MDKKAEVLWKWILRGLGIGGFIFLLLNDLRAPVAYYVFLAGLLGLPNIISLQQELRREQKTRSRRTGFDDGPRGRPE